MGGYSDTWTQTVTFDYTKINKVHVWKIDKSKVNGMAELTGTNEITASIVQGDPTIFANIAASNTSAAGRLRYSLETNQHDHVVWNEGNSDNRDANSDSDSYVNEQATFKKRRALTTNVTAVQMPIELPLSPEKNNITALQKQPMRLGYNVFADVETTGDYYANLQIIPYYYQLNLQTGKYMPVDVYMLESGEYKPINKFEIVKPGWDNKSIYPYTYSLKWVEEAGRRNYSKAEEETTNAVTDYLKMRESATATGKTSQPSGDNYQFVTAQISTLTGRNRTYIGSMETYGEFKNPGYRLDNEEFGMQAQRWHFTYGLPSSAVVVAKGKPVTKGNIEDLRNNTSVLVMAADIKAIGEVYALQYKVPGGNKEIKISGTRYPTTSIPYPVITVFSGNKSSADDLEISGTH